MIQIGKIRKGFEFIEEIEAQSVPELFKSAKNIVEKIPESERYNLFYTLAHHTKGKRSSKDDSFRFQEVIPFDVDGIDLNQLDKYAEIVCETLGIDYNKTGIVHSGNGIHLIVQVKKFSTPAFFQKNKKRYKALCKKIDAALKDAGLTGNADSVVFDQSRIFRLPFTKNIKQKNNSQIEKECVLIQGNIQIQDLKFDENADAAKNGPPQPGDDDSVFHWGKVDQDGIMEQCDFMKWADERPTEVKEPAWYAILSITSRFDDENKTSRRLTEKYSSSAIDAADKDLKIEQAKQISGPRSCEGIDEIWGRCEGCKWFKKINSPIKIKSENFISSEDCGFTTWSGKKMVRQFLDLWKAWNRDNPYKNVGATRALFKYNGTHFEPLHEPELKEYAQHRFIPDAHQKDRNEFVDLVKSQNVVPANFLESTKDGFINFKNGVYELETGALVPHNPDFNFFYCLPYDYDPNAACPTWDSFLSDMMLGREDLISILNEYIGYIIRGGDYIHHKALILSGSGKNGKSTFINILRKLVGEGNYSETSVTSIQDDKYAVASLHGKLVNFSEEEPPSCFKETGKFKTITGNAGVMAELKYGNPWPMRNKAKIVITYNKIPYLGDTTIGMRRRLLIVPCDFDLNEVPEKVDPNIEEKLEAELPGIFLRALQGWHRLEKQSGFTFSEHVENKIDEIAILSDSVFAFIEECLNITKDESDFVALPTMYEAYTDHHHDQSENAKPVSKKAFSQRLKHFSLKSTRIKSDGKVFRGVRGVKFKGSVGSDSSGKVAEGDEF